jgi:hypothetical protein
LRWWFGGGLGHAGRSGWGALGFYLRLWDMSRNISYIDVGR